MKVCPKCGKQFSDDANFCPVDAARLAAADTGGATEADPLAARFDLSDRLGGGTTGEVLRGVDRQSGRHVAVKVLAPSVLGLPQIAQRIERELKQLERVDAPSIARVLGSGKRGEQVWVATELVDGAQSLAHVLAGRGPFEPTLAATLVATIGEALIEAAKVGVVHRDLAPKNVLLVGGDPSRVKLINFCAPTPTSDRAPGVPEYVAPEVIEGKQLDQRSNIYSLGAIYYHVLAGQAPFVGELAQVHAAHLTGGAEPPSRRVPVPADVDGVVMRALERNPAKRYLTVRQFVDEVQRVARGQAAGGTAMLGAAGKQRSRDAIQTMLGVPPAAGGMAAPVVPTAAPPAPSGPVIELTQPKPPAQAAPQVLATAPGMGHDNRSPWAAPGGGADGGAFAPAAAAVAQAGPGIGAVAAQMPPAAVMPAMPAAPVMPSAPVVPATTTAPPAGKKRGPEAEDKSAKGKFRETMWFKKGELDAAAAEAAAEEAARTGKVGAPDKVDSLPSEDRYNDDGTLSRGDREKYSLKTGDTTMMPAVKTGPAPDVSVSERELVGELKGKRHVVFWIVFVLLLAGGGYAIYYFLA